MKGVRSVPLYAPSAVRCAKTALMISFAATVKCASNAEAARETIVPSAAYAKCAWNTSVPAATDAQNVHIYVLNAVKNALPAQRMRSV